MTIAPVIASVDVKCAPARAFEIFTTRIGDWWAKGQTIGKNPHVAIIIEPHADGRWYERDADGNESSWGKVLVWDPPERLVLGWQLNAQFRFDPAMLTQVELTFTAKAGGGTNVRLEHRDLERFGDDAARVAHSIGSGWPTRLGGFADFCTQITKGEEP
jgi:uncharacterized protein YndB with AHSA1/START domain